MPAKDYNIADIGIVHIFKRRGSKSIRMGFDSKGDIRVSIPLWAPYQSGVNFVLSRKDWVAKHQPVPSNIFRDGDRIGKAHHMTMLSDSNVTTVQVRLRGSDIVIKYPNSEPYDGTKVQSAAERGAKKALLLEGERLLPQRLSLLAAQHGFTYIAVSIKQLKTKWGSCDQTKHITLNYYLMQLPWNLIDYVLIHELVHTEHLNHSDSFWERFEQSLPDAKKIRKELRTYKTSVIAT